MCFMFESYEHFKATPRRLRGIYPAWKHTGLAECLEEGRYIKIKEHTERRAQEVNKNKRQRKGAGARARAAIFAEQIG